MTVDELIKWLAVWPRNIPVVLLCHGTIITDVYPHFETGDDEIGKVVLE